MHTKRILSLILCITYMLGFGVISISAAETVYVSTISEFQSAHSYANNMDKTWVYTHSTYAESLSVTFSSDTETENNYDYIYILDGNNNQIEKYCGTSLAGKIITVPGNVVKIRLISDSSQTKYGFRVTSITASSSTTPSTPSGSLSGFASGSGTSTSPYIINTTTHLLYFAEKLTAGYTFAGEYIKLNNNLNMTGYLWDSTFFASFDGTFLGNNKTITINTRFLKNIGESGVVDWLNVTAIETLTDINTLLCDNNSGTIQNCRVKGNVDMDDDDAGLLCSYNYGYIYNSCGFGTLSGYVKGNDCWVGWVLTNNGTIINCYTVLTLSGTATGRYNDEYLGDINAIGTAAQNCYGKNSAIANSQEFVDKLNQLTAVSGYAWVVDESNVNDGYPVIEKCLNATTRLSYSSESMFAFYSSSITTSITSNVSGCTIYYTIDGTNPTTSSTRKTYSSSLTFSSDFEIRTTAYKNGSYSVPRVQYGIKLYGSGTASNPYQIKSNLGLYAIRFAPDKCYSLEADLDFTNDAYITNGASAQGWTPINAFTGSFDGKCHSIIGISGTRGGLFSSNDGTIENLRLLRHRLCNKNGDFGSIANNNSGLITKCYSSTDTNPPYTCSYIGSYVGGIAGNNTNGEISYCYTTGLLGATAEVNYSHYSIGGIAGRNGTVRSCMSDIDIITPYSSHDLGCDACGMVPGGKSIDCRYDGTITVNAYDAFVSIGSNSFSTSQANDTSRCYNGGFVLIRQSGTGGRDHINSGTNCYTYTNTYRDYLESSFPAFDFTTTWMITEDGPMPQGIMNADGTYYSKQSYIAPTCNNDGKTVYIDQNNRAITKTLSKYPHSLSEGVCTNSGCNHKEVYEINLLYNNEIVPANFEMDTNRTYQLTTSLIPSDALDQTITWSTSDDTVATVSDGGLVSAVGEGKVTITATASNGVSKSVTVNASATPYLNKIKIEADAAIVGENGIKIPVYMATDKDANFIYCILQYPSDLNLKEVIARDFAVVEIEDEYTENNFTTLVLNCLYSEADNIIKHHTFIPFELTFDISKSAEPGTVQIELTEESCLIGNETYFFEERIPGTLEILPKLAESIEISGADVISSETTYTAIVNPDYTTDKSVEWSVDNEEVAIVSEYGVVTPVTSGTFTLTATTKDGSGVTASKTITVTRCVTSIEITGADSITEATTYSANITPDYATNKEVEWSISNSDIATISQSGLVTPITSGLVTITATAKDGSDVVATKEINIIKLAESIVITGEDSISSPAQYTATVSPDYTSDKDVSWSVDNEEIATVDELGIVSPVTSGTVILTATAKDGSGVVARKTIEIIKFAESIEIVGSEEITEPSQYSVVILPEYTTNKDAQWSVSDETVATVDENGVVTPLKNGKIVLTAKAEDASGIETTKSIVITVSVRANSITSDVGIWDKEFDSDITEYTINVPVGTTAIYLTSSFTNATAKVNGTIAANGVRKKVSLTGNETNVEILLTPTSGNNLKANTYTINIICGSFTKTTVSEDKKIFNVFPTNVETGKTVILALYNGGRFVEIQRAIYNGEAILFRTTKTYTNAKIMVWDDIATLNPVCQSEEL